MSFSEKQTQALHALAEYEPIQAVVETASFLLASEDGVTESSHGIRGQWEGVDEKGSDLFLPHKDILTIHLSDTALILALLHPDTAFPRISLAAGINQVNDDLPPINVRVHAADHINRPIDTRTEGLNIIRFETDFVHSLSILGLSRHVPHHLLAA